MSQNMTANGDAISHHPMRVVKVTELETMVDEIDDESIPDIIIQRTPKLIAKSFGVFSKPEDIDVTKPKAILPLTGQTLKVTTDNNGSYFFKAKVSESPRIPTFYFTANEVRNTRKFSKDEAELFLKSLRLCQLLIKGHYQRRGHILAIKPL